MIAQAQTLDGVIVFFFFFLFSFFFAFLAEESGEKKFRI